MNKESLNNFSSILFFIFFLIYAIYLFTIVKFIILPLILLFSGLLITIIFKDKSLEIYLFFLPLTGALPSFFKTGYPHNYLSSPFFLLVGIIGGFVLIKKTYFLKKENTSEEWQIFYNYFLFFLLLSVFFVFLRWSNITLSLKAFFKDTPVSVKNLRLSFAAIFPLLTIIEFSIAIVFYSLLKKQNISKEKVLNYLTAGYSISVIIALIQKFINPYFFVARFGENDWFKYQKNGSFCDQNSFVFFSGILIFLAIYLTIKKNKISYSYYLPLYFLGGFLSGAKIFYLFLIFSFIILLLFTNKKRRITLILIFIFSFIFFFFTFGNVSEQRIVKSIRNVFNVASSKNSKSKINSLNTASNGRVEMIKNSIDIVKSFPIEGVGAGNFLFYLEYLKFGKKHIHDLPLNEYLRIIDEMGITGLLFFLLFLFFLFKKMKIAENLIFFSVLTVFLFGNYLWIPEAVLIFWLLIYSLEKRKQVRIGSFWRYIFLIFIFTFIIFNTFDIKKLNPVNLVTSKGEVYDYGFWQKEIDNKGRTYKWTKAKAGIYINGKEKNKIEIFCGAPLEQFPTKQQKVIIFWKGKRLKEIIFSKNINKKIIIPEEKGFFEIRVYQTFNLKKMKLGDDNRELGIIVYL